MFDRAFTLFISTLSLSNRNEVMKHANKLRMHSLYEITHENFDVAVYSQSTSTVVTEIPGVNDSISCICSPSSSVRTRDVYQILQAENEIIRRYIDYTSNGNNEYSTTGWFPFFLTDVSCSLFDSKTNHLWLISDLVGASPIWYSIQHSLYNSTTKNAGKGQIIATTDLILAVLLGFKQPTPLGAGQIVVIDLEHLEVILTGFRDSRRRVGKYENPEYYAYNLLASSMSSLESILEMNSSILMEIDRSEPASVLLECSLNCLGKQYSARLARSLVQDVPSNLPIELVDIISGLVDDYRAPHSEVWSPKFSRVAYERWLICEAATLSNTLISFDLGLKSRPLEVYLQNLFCGYLNVKVIYPFNARKFQLSLWSTTYMNSYFYYLRQYVLSKTGSYLFQAVNILSSRNECGGPLEIGTRDFKLGDFEIAPCVQSGCIDFSVPFSNGSSLSLLWKSAQSVATKENNQVVVVLVTSGYLDIFSNFLCSLSALNFHNLLVLTDSTDIADVSVSAGHSVYSPVQYILDDKIVDYADFGSLIYQKLMLFRSETVMKLLKLGFRVLLSDIDTVWKSDPLAPASLSRSDGLDFDIAVTDDHGEVCGCYIYFNSTEAALDFWGAVLNGHRDIITFAMLNNSGNLRNFHDSEQKILTKLLYDKMYNANIMVSILDSDRYPSGFSYFNEHSPKYKSKMPVIIHNNFLIGKSIKRHRFVRYDLWNYDEYEANKNKGSLFCKRNKLEDWELIFNGFHKEIRIPTVTFVLPVHEDYIDKDTFLVQVAMEGFAANDSYGKLYIGNDPPSYISFKTLGVFELKTGAISVGSLTAIIGDSNLEVSVDYSRDRTLDFSIDRNDKALSIANSRVKSYKMLRDEVIDVFDICKVDSDNNDPRKICTFGPRSFLFNDSNTIYGAEQSMNEQIFVSNFSFIIKVIAYNRPLSLLRLLKSLISAHYDNNTVNIEIIIDGPKNDDEREIVEYVVKVASEFSWGVGEKKVKLRKQNIGLAKQWYYAWVPSSDTEIAFVFEDDIEVSPLYFRWAISAAQKYYTPNVRLATWELLNAVRGHVDTNGSTVFNSNSSRGGTFLDLFVEKYAGIPLPYGICLQKQHLDPFRYPKKLRVENKHRPFMFSLIGSWGPMFFPLAWQSFREWWAWASKSPIESIGPFVKGIITDYFFRSNNFIWTPWMVRFAFETGLKCIYSNFPGNLSLVINHREIGENYQKLKGAYSALLTTEDPLLFKLPSYSFLARWQLDFNLRRAGSFGNGKLMVSFEGTDDDVIRSAQNISAEYSLYCEIISEMNKAMTFLDLKTKFNHLHMPDKFFALSDILEAHGPSDSSFLFIGLSHMIPFIISQSVLSVNLVNHEKSKACSVLSQASKLSNTTIICEYVDESFLVKSDIRYDFLVFSIGPDGDETVVYDVLHSNRISPSYLLVTANCDWAPTDLSIVSRAPHFDYSLVEQMCDENTSNDSLMLYRKVSELDKNWYINRHALSRRLRGGLITTKFISKKIDETFL